MINKAIIAAESDSDPTDFVEIAIQKESRNKTEISAKYSKSKGAIRSSALISMMQDNISKS